MAPSTPIPNFEVEIASSIDLRMGADIYATFRNPFIRRICVTITKWY